MTNHFLNLLYLRTIFPSAKSLIVYSAFLCLLSIENITAMLLLSYGVNAQSLPTPSVTQSPNSSPGGDIQAQQARLSGQWQSNNQASGQGA